MPRNESNRHYEAGDCDKMCRESESLDCETANMTLHNPVWNAHNISGLISTKQKERCQIIGTVEEETCPKNYKATEI